MSDSWSTVIWDDIMRFNRPIEEKLQETLMTWSDDSPVYPDTELTFSLSKESINAKLHGKKYCFFNIYTFLMYYHLNDISQYDASGLQGNIRKAIKRFKSEFDIDIDFLPMRLNADSMELDSCLMYATEDTFKDWLMTLAFQNEDSAFFIASTTA